MSVDGIDMRSGEPERKDGGPAYPVAFTTTPLKGMSLRDYFAAQAMQGLCSNTEWLKNAAINSGDALAACVSAAYEVADAMLKERAK